MKKLSLMVLFCVFTHNLLFAQLIQSVSGVIKYRIKLNESEVNKYDLASYLYFNTQMSLYIYDRRKDIEPKDSLEYNANRDGQDDTLVKARRKRDNYGRMYLKDNETQTLKMREFIHHKPFMTVEKIPILKWTISSERKKIGSFKCQKATTTFRGRTYEAWFCTAIPLSIGPWKLHGLPGAILEARSKDGAVAFELESMEIPKDVQAQLTFTELPSGEIVPFEEFKTLPAREFKRAETEAMALVLFILEKANIKEDKLLGPPKISKPFYIELNYD